MKDTLVVDFETKYSFAEVGGESNIRDLGISVAGVYSYRQDSFFAFEERELGSLETMFYGADLVIGFNVRHFDIPVIEPYLKSFSFADVKVLDIFEDAVRFLGHRVGLNALAKATLFKEKSGHGLEALQWFREGRVEDVKKYCLDDVRITRDLYEFGKKNKHVLFRSNTDGKIHSIPVEWGESSPPVRSLLEDALSQKRRLAIEYVSSQDSDGLGYHKARFIDIYKVKKDEVEAYCHLRKSLRVFRINRITKAELTEEIYSLPVEQVAILS